MRRNKTFPQSQVFSFLSPETWQCRVWSHPLGGTCPACSPHIKIPTWTPGPQTHDPLGAPHCLRPSMSAHPQTQDYMKPLEGDRPSAWSEQHPGPQRAAAQRRPSGPRASISHVQSPGLAWLGRRPPVSVPMLVKGPGFGQGHHGGGATQTHPHSHRGSHA